MDHGGWVGGVYIEPTLDFDFLALSQGMIMSNETTSFLAPFLPNFKSNQRQL
jgi:hypothetical protein